MLLARLQDDGFHPSVPSLFDRSICHSPRLFRLRSRLFCLEYVSTKRHDSVLARALFTLTNKCLTGTLIGNGYRFPPFNHSLLSTAIVNIKEGSLLSSTSSLATFSKAAVSNRSQGCTSRYSSPLDAPRAGSSFFRKRPSSSSCWGAKRGRGGFLPPHHLGQSLRSGGGLSAPKGSLRAGSAFFAGLLQPFFFFFFFFFFYEGLRDVVASIKSRFCTSLCSRYIILK